MKRVVLVFAVAGCAGPEPVDAFAVHVSWQALPFACPQRSTIGAQMEAHLEVSGNFAPCPLAVNTTTLTVSGSCPEIIIGCYRPLAIAYSYNDGVNPSVPLAYLIGAVDLREDALSGDGDAVTVNLVADGVSGELLYEDAAVAALPDATDVPPCSQPGPRDLDDVRMWAKEHLTNEQVRFDVDVDNTANLEEACAGTIFQ
ncbi:MAG: hypothetical protein HYZ27_04450 [Deltaproteobacteria bacterium]|nr:hypothetical protein [Deltaproteobacteria bacterium]